MDKPTRKQTRLTKYDYSQNGCYFVTICTHNREKILSRISVGTPVPGCPQEICGTDRMYFKTELLRHGQIADKYIRQLDAFYQYLSVDKYVIMPDHIHFLIRIERSGGHPRTGVPTKIPTIGRFVGTFKRFCNQEFGSNIWQGRYYDHVVRNQQDYNEIWEYIENNPANWIINNQNSI